MARRTVVRSSTTSFGGRLPRMILTWRTSPGIVLLATGFFVGLVVGVAWTAGEIMKSPPPPSEPIMTTMMMMKDRVPEEIMERDPRLQEEEEEEEEEEESDWKYHRRGMERNVEPDAAAAAAAEEEAADELGVEEEDDRPDATVAIASLGRHVADALDMGEEDEDEEPALWGHSSPSSDKPLLVHKGDVQLLVTDAQYVQTTEQNIAQYCQTHGGYVQHRQVYNSFHEEDPPSQWRSPSPQSIDLRMRIPSPEFDPFLSFLRSLQDTVETKDEDMGRRPRVLLLSLSSTTEDVTLRYRDVKARAETLETSRKALAKLLKHADKVHDVLDVTRELNQITQQAEAQRQQALHFQNQASMSEVKISIRPTLHAYNEPPPEEPSWWFVDWDPLYTLDIAFGGLLSCIFGVLDGVIFVLVWSLPLLCFLACCARCHTVRTKVATHLQTFATTTYNTMPLRQRATTTAAVGSNNENNNKSVV